MRSTRINLASVTGLPTFQGDDYTFYCARGELSYEVQHSTNLVSWSSMVTNAGIEGHMATVNFTPGPAATRGLLRSKVTRP